MAIVKAGLMDEKRLVDSKAEADKILPMGAASIKKRTIPHVIHNPKSASIASYYPSPVR
jgi:hypothetical protein